MAEQTYSWAYSLVDSSQVSTFLISILLIVYGSFRSLNMDFENQDKEKDSNSSSGSFNGNSTNNSSQDDASKEDEPVATKMAEAAAL